MTPIRTRHTNATLMGGAGVDPLPCTQAEYVDGLQFTESAWRPSLREWPMILLRRTVYLQCLGHKHPPVHVAAKSDIPREWKGTAP